MKRTVTKSYKSLVSAAESYSCKLIAQNLAMTGTLVNTVPTFCEKFSSLGLTVLLYAKLWKLQLFAGQTIAGVKNQRIDYFTTKILVLREKCNELYLSVHIW